MKTVVYDKLVRDNMQEVIKEDGNEGDFHQIPQSELTAALKQKLREEVDEFIAEPSINELADILEVVCALNARLGSSWENLEAICKLKYEKRGGFKKGLWLDRVRYLNVVTDPNSGKEYGSK